MKYKIMMAGVFLSLLSTPAIAVTVTSASFANNGMIPAAQACMGKGGNDASPQITWAGLPAGTTHVSIIMDDEVAPCGTGAAACVHWNAFDIPVVATSSLTEGVTNNVLTNTFSAVLGTGYNGGLGYQGACPPAQHTYKLTVFAQSAATGKTQGTFSDSRASFTSQYGSGTMIRAGRNIILGSGTISGGYPSQLTVPATPPNYFHKY